MKKLQINETDLEKIITESVLKTLNEGSVYQDRVMWPAANIMPYKNGGALVKTSPSTGGALVKTSPKTFPGFRNHQVQDLGYNYEVVKSTPSTPKALPAGKTKVPKAGILKRTGAALGTAGKAIGAFAGTTAGAITIGAVAAAAVAAGTMIYLNNRNKKGLEALKEGMWDGKYPWENQEIKIAMPNPGRNRGNGNPTATPPTQSTTTPPSTNNTTRNTTDLPNLNNSAAGAIVRNKLNGDTPQMQTQTTIGVPTPQARSTVNNPRIAQMQKNGRSANAIGNAAIRQQNRTLRNMGLNQTQFNSKQLGNN